MSDHSSKNVNQNDKGGIEYFNQIDGTSNSSTGQYGNFNFNFNNFKN